MAFLLGIDIGTSATKALLIDETGAVRASAECAHEISRPYSGWSEQDPEWWWGACRQTCRTILAGADLAANKIAAIAFSGQMHGAILLARHASAEDPRVVRPAILWNDQRTARECDEIEQAAGGRERLIAMVGNAALTGFTAPKILWIRRHEPETFAHAARLLLPKDYVRFRLTGVQAIDVGDASGTLLLDPATRDWHAELPDLLEIDRRLLPPVVESTARAGTVTPWAAAQTGLAAGTPVIAGSGDQMTGAVGAGVIETCLVSATLGTSGVVFAHTGRTLPHDPEGRVQVMCAAVPGEYCVYGCMLSAAGALQWFRDAFAPELSFAELDRMAADVPIGAGGLLFLPYLTGERCPHADPGARGGFIGLTARHGRGHLARAVLEGVACGMAEMLDLIRRLDVRPTELRLLGGGAKSPLWCEIQANVSSTAVSVPATAEGSAYGAALLAGVGEGVWSNVAEACRACLTTTERFTPTPSHVERYSRVRESYSSFYPLLKDSFAGLREIEGTGDPDS